MLGHWVPAAFLDRTARKPGPGRSLLWVLCKRRVTFSLTRSLQGGQRSPARSQALGGLFPINLSLAVL